MATSLIVSQGPGVATHRVSGVVSSSSPRAVGKTKAPRRPLILPLIATNRESDKSWVVSDKILGWHQNNGNRSNQESKFDFLATCEKWQKRKLSAPTNNQIYGVPANQISPSAGTSLI